MSDPEELNVAVNVHLDDPALLEYPGGHATQAELAIAPVEGLYVPAAQLAHAELPGAVLYWPAGHRVQLDAPAALYEPAAQAA
jgi:hypothetical protein